MRRRPNPFGTGERGAALRSLEVSLHLGDDPALALGLLGLQTEALLLGVALLADSRPSPDPYRPHHGEDGQDEHGIDATERPDGVGSGTNRA